MTETLFDLSAAEMRRSAHISTDGLYRYSLHRDWHDYSTHLRPRWVTFVMLNPSTADADQDDPTIRRCIGFAKALGGTALAVVNLYAFRATSPADLWKAEDPVGPLTDTVLAQFLDMASRYDHPIIAAWGAHARPDRVAWLMSQDGSERLQALHTTKSGAPGHPLYLPASCVPTPWPGGA